MKTVVTMPLPLRRDSNSVVTKSPSNCHAMMRKVTNHVSPRCSLSPTQPHHALGRDAPLGPDGVFGKD